MGERGMKFDVAFTSDLERAWRTCAIVLAGTTDGHLILNFHWCILVFG